MSFSYGSDPLHNNIDQVRFLTGNTVKEESLVDDEEIAFTLAKYNNNINAACCLVCESIAARLAKKKDVKVSNYATSQDTLYDKFTKLAERFRTKGLTTAAFIMPSMSVSDKENNEDDDDKVKPSFKRDLFDNPQATAPADFEKLT